MEVDGHEITNFDYSAADGNDRVIFDFGESGGKTITLDVDSAMELGLGEDTFQSINGTVNSSAAKLELKRIINSSITFHPHNAEGSNLANLNGARELNILIDDSFQVDVHTIDLSALAALPGGSKPPVVKIDAGDSIGFGEKDVTLPGGSEPVVVLLRTAGGDGEFASIGGFDESAQYFLENTSVFNETQVDALFAAIETNAPGIGGTFGSDVTQVSLGSNIAIEDDFDLTNFQAINFSTGGFTLDIADNSIYLTASQADGARIVALRAAR